MLDEKNKAMSGSAAEGFQRRVKNLPVVGNRKAQVTPANMFRSALATLAITALLVTGTAALGGTLSFKADLSGGGEAPPNNSSGKGRLNATLDTETKTLTWTASYSGLTGTPIGAHFHGPISYIGLTPEENAPIQVGTPGSLASPFKGSTTIDATQMKDLKDGRWYFNIHTQAFRSGEIRGPVVRQ